MSRNPTKAAHYVSLLDQVRCEGDWDAVPECVRKVRKHAPERVCLTLTAETELAIEKSTRNAPPGAVPSRTLEVADQLPKLQGVLQEESAHPQDRFQARVCIGWLHWVVGDYELALQELPTSLDKELASGAPESSTSPLPTSTPSDWTRVCALKATYLRANCLARRGQRKEALAVFENGLSCVVAPADSSAAAPPPQHQQLSRKQLRYWSELYLTEFCMLFSHTLEQGEVSLTDANCLASLRSWAQYWEGCSPGVGAGGHGFRGSVPRRRIWFEYYAVLSELVEEDLPYPTGYAGHANGNGRASPRDQLRAELKKVEGVYEALLLEETTFPRAEEEREEVEEFVRLVMQNWALLKGHGWREQDLGQGGKESMSRGVLEILYRAATKTYHSTALLRHLFTVHLAVAEFDLAFKAFDSYLNLVKKGKARVAKSGKEEPSLDEDEVVLETVSLCISALCRYGGRDAAEKARGLSLQLEQCLQELGQPGGGVIPEQAAANNTTNLVARTSASNVPPRVLALAWQAVGLAHAQWARMTFDAASRSEIQAKAVRCLRKSISPEFSRTANLRSVFALGLLLAEQREIGAAIDLVKSALLAKPNTTANAAGDAADPQDRTHGPYWRERSMIPLWHLLSLLLSARQDYLMAARACEGAFEQFKDPAILFGNENLYRSEHLNEAEATAAAATSNGHGGSGGGSSGTKPGTATHGLVDEMDDFEKERILGVKMTQLALLELMESPKVAVNASLELLSLFTRLFGSYQSSKPALAAPPKTGDVPRSSAGTLRSIRGSFFGRHGGAAENKNTVSGRPTTAKASATPGTAIASRPQTQASSRDAAAPAIHVDTDAESRRSRRSSYNLDDKRSQSHKRNSLRKRDRSSGGSSSGRPRAASSGPAAQPYPKPPSVVDGEAFYTPMEEGSGGSSTDFMSFSPSSRRRLSSSGGPPVSMSRQASQVESITAAAPRLGGGGLADMANMSGGSGVEPSFSLMPVVQFSQEHEKRRKSAILVEVWLMIAGFYRRAGMVEDAKAAISEAQKLVQTLEADVTRDTSGSVSLRNAGWAGKKSVDELWGDVWAELGNLALAKGVPYTARAHFETALVHFPDHPAGIVGLSNILLDIYSEKLLPAPAIPQLELADGSIFPERPNTTGKGYQHLSHRHLSASSPPLLPTKPLGLVFRDDDDVDLDITADFGAKSKAAISTKSATSSLRVPGERKSVLDWGDDWASSLYPEEAAATGKTSSTAAAAAAAGIDAEAELPPPYKASSLPLIDRLAARDRAFGLLSGLTKLGSAWNDAEAWFALARAHEESGHLDKAKEALWWCVELEEAAGVRPWTCVSTGGYVL